MNKSRHLTFRCTEDEYKLIKAAAERLGMSVSGFILQCAMFGQEAVNSNDFVVLGETVQQ